MPSNNGYNLYQHTSLLALVGLLVMALFFRSTRYPASLQAQGGSSLRFYGSDTNDRDRVKIPLGQIDSTGRLITSHPVNVGDAFTLEFWMKTALGNTAPPCPTGWYTGNIIIDRDVFGAGDYGDYGVAICNQRLVVGISVGSDDRLLIGNTVVTDGLWHHIAIVRANDGKVRLFVDGQLDGTLNGPVGRIDYRQNRSTSYPTSDPYLVLGAEKHDFPGSRYYDGWIDDMRISRIARYTSPFIRPTVPHAVDDDTVALYRFDEGSGVVIGDSAPGGLSVGELKPRTGGAAQHWSNDTPFTTVVITTATHTVTPVPSPTPTHTATPVPSPTPTHTATPVPSPTPTHTATPVPLPTPTHTATPVPLPTPTHTATPVPLPTPTGTAKPMPSPTIVSVPPTTTPTLPIRIYIPLILQPRLAPSTLQSGVAPYDQPNHQSNRSHQSCYYQPT
ncbi:LamG domain-containing protein [Candidatus Parcubacteria bacterium]|jgi:hypothetical protein|nr:MAG: LamG domain-containing protein [Candidatus Parcubacteria bacterium]